MNSSMIPYLVKAGLRRDQAWGVSVCVWAYCQGKPQNMRVVAGNSSIAVRVAEVLGTIGGGQNSVILLSGQIDVSSLSAACTGGAASGGNDLFSFGTMEICN